MTSLLAERAPGPLKALRESAVVLAVLDATYTAGPVPSNEIIAALLITATLVIAGRGAARPS